MTNRSRRDGERNIRLSEAQMRQPGIEEKEESARVASRDSQASHLAEQFDYVGADLKRILLVSAIMLAILISLALILP